MRVYCIYDTVAEEGSSLVEAKNDGVARRIFEDTIAKYKLDPKETQLICLGNYDAEQPVLSGLLVPEYVDVNVEDDDE